MQLCVSNRPTAKVHKRLVGQETSLQCRNDKCTRQHDYVEDLRYKSTYTQGFTTQEITSDNIALLHEQGFSSYTYRAPTEDDIPPTMRFLINQGKIDFTRGWRKASTTVSLLPTHWQDYDPKQDPLSPAELSQRWAASKRLNGTSAWFLASSSAVGVRILYEGLSVDLATKHTKNMLIAERELLEQELGITLDKSKASPGAHSGHLRLSLPITRQEELVALAMPEDISTRYYTAQLLALHPDINTEHYPVYPEDVYLKVPNSMPLEVVYSQPTSTSTELTTRDVSGYNSEVFDDKRPAKGSEVIAISPAIVLPASFVLYQGGKPITPAELAIQCLDRQYSEGPPVATNVPYAQDKQYSSRMDSALWYYSEDRGVLYGHEEGNTTVEAQGYTPRFSIPLRIHSVAVTPAGAKKLTDSLYIAEGKLYNVISIGTAHPEILGKAAALGFLDLQLLAELYPYIMKIGGKDRFFLVPNNTLLSLPDHYTVETLFKHLEGLDYNIMRGAANEDTAGLTKEEVICLKMTYQHISAFLLANCPDIKSTSKKFGYPLGTMHEVHTGILTTYSPMVALKAPKEDRPSQDALDKANKFMKEYQGYDVDLEARFVTARMYDIMPDGYRECYSYDNRVSGSGKSEIAEVAAELKINPDIDPEELLADGLNGMELSIYGSYRSVTIDEADTFPKLTKWLRKATGKGIAARASFGVSEQVSLRHVKVCSAQGIKDLSPDVIDDQERDRMYEIKQASTEKFKDLYTRGKVPLSYSKMRMSLSWLMYEAFLKYEELWTRDTMLTTELTELRQDSISGDPIGRICLRVLGYGLRRLKADYYFNRELANKTNKYPSLIKEKITEDGFPPQTQKPYTRVEDSRFYNGIHIRKKGQICIDSVDVIFDAVDELNEPSRLKTKINENRKLIPLLLGKPFKRRVSRSIISGEEEFVGSYMAISELTIPEEILEHYLCNSYITPQALLDMSIDKLEEIYTRGSRVVAPNYEQLAEIVIEYTRRSNEEIEEEEHITTKTANLQEEVKELW